MRRVQRQLAATAHDMNNLRSGMHRAAPSARQHIYSRAARALTAALTFALRAPTAAPAARQPRRIEAIVRDFKGRVNDYLSEALRLDSETDKASADMSSLAKSSAAMVTDACLAATAAAARAPILAAGLQTAASAAADLCGRSQRACAELTSAGAAAQTTGLSVHA